MRPLLSTLRLMSKKSSSSVSLLFVHHVVELLIKWDITLQRIFGCGPNSTVNSEVLKGLKKLHLNELLLLTNKVAIDSDMKDIKSVRVETDHPYRFSQVGGCFFFFFC
jgi:hypothetical protein